METNSNCDTCLFEDEAIRMDIENSIPLDVISHYMSATGSWK